MTIKATDQWPQNGCSSVDLPGGRRVHLRIETPAGSGNARVMIQLDANGSTAMLPEVIDAMLPWLRDGHANPSGAYAAARQARQAIEEARGQVAEWIGAEADEIVFTSGGTESVNTALHSMDQLVGAGAAVVSAGSACMAGKIRPSHVQLAMGIDGPRGRGSLRFSFSMLNTPAEAHDAAEIVKRAVERLRLANLRGLDPGIASSPCGLVFS